jgi:hypothetical protein
MTLLECPAGSHITIPSFKTASEEDNCYIVTCKTYNTSTERFVVDLDTGRMLKLANNTVVELFY